MARNLREGSLGQVNVKNTSGGPVYGGYVYAIDGIAGVAVTDAAADEVVALDRRPYVHYLFGATATTPPAPDTPDALKPEVPGYDFTGATVGGTVSLGGVLNVQVIEIGPGDVYNTPADHVLVSVLPA